mgnify:CR=1 FL=1
MYIGMVKLKSNIDLTQKINHDIERIGGWDKFIHSGDIVLLKVLVLQAMIRLQIGRDTYMVSTIWLIK